jgi:hypothetical protein
MTYYNNSYLLLSLFHVTFTTQRYNYFGRYPSYISNAVRTHWASDCKINLKKLIKRNYVWFLFSPIKK